MNSSLAQCAVLPHHKVIGERGPAVVLLHGLFGDGDNLGALARHLAPDYQVVLADLRNHGQSPHCDSMSLSEMAADVVALQDHLGLPATAVVGHSLGGKVAMQMALTYPASVSRLVVADIAPVRYPPHHTNVFAALRAVDLSQITRRADADRQLAPLLPERALRMFLLKSLYRTPGGWRWRLNLPVIMDRYDEQLSAPPAGEPYRGPALFIKGEQSDYITAEHEGVIGALFPAFEFKMISGTGHWLHGEKPAAFNRLVGQFLAE